jgi:cation diffusion facilitator family transporter
MGDQCRQRCETCAARVATWVIAGNAVLGLFKLVAAAITHSAAIGVDGVQSLACALVGGIIAAGIRVGRRPADTRFPLGYGKAEFLVSILSYSGLFGLGVVMASSACYLLAIGRSAPPMVLALPVALISAVANYWMYSACRCAGRATQSAGLMANAGQNQADMISSASVAVSVVLCQIGPSFYFFDALAALAAAVMIMIDAGRSWWSDMQVLIDGPVREDLLRGLQATAAQAEGVDGVRFARGRRTGRGVRVELGVEVASARTVSETQRIGAELRGDLLQRLRWVDEVEVYAFPGRAGGRGDSDRKMA